MIQPVNQTITIDCGKGYDTLHRTFLGADYTSSGAMNQAIYSWLLLMSDWCDPLV